MRTVDEAVSDAVWTAVNAADDAGWDYTRFKAEVTEAWRECLRRFPARGKESGGA